jgi:hypothetical protein
MRLFHYTYSQKFLQIAADGVLKLATAHVPKREKAVVWFSFNPVWEPTVNAMRFSPDGRWAWLSMEETSDKCGGLVRIEVAPETAPVTWAVYKQRSGITSKMAKGLLHGARETGAKPSEWRCSWEPVPRSLWLAVEVWHEGQWSGDLQNAKRSVGGS